MVYKIVLPEGNDERVQVTAKTLIQDAVCHPIVIGDRKKLTKILGSNGAYTPLDADDSHDVLLQGAQLVKEGKADGIVAGAVYSTPDVLRAYIKVIGTKKGVSRATSCFLMEKGMHRYLFADCAVNIDPSPTTLAETAFLCDEFAKIVHIKSKIAFLSFSTKGSAKHKTVDKMTEAFHITRERWPDIIADGELQFDAAFIPSVSAIKAPSSPLKGKATIFIFPDLNSGNIAYKLVERLGEFKATGPLLLGFAKPAHDLSRGCNAGDIVRAVKIACLQCE